MEKTINRESVLRNTNWGVDIYAFILRKFYPDGIVMKVTGRDCGYVRNPFAGGAQNLHVWFTKNDPDAKLSDETAYHHDESGTIADGDALLFAEFYFHQSGQELLETINREMCLHLDESSRQYGNAPLAVVEHGPRFSFFRGPITNIHALKSITIYDAFNYISGPYAKERTEELRAIPDKKAAKIYKQSRFDYATFCGEFDVRSNDTIKTVSNLLCVDFDHVPDVEGLFVRLLDDKYFNTALLFRSPSGDGLKWIIEIDRGPLSHSDFFRAVENYVSKTYEVKIDTSGKDISRPCFLCYDPKAYINPNYLQ